MLKLVIMATIIVTPFCAAAETVQLSKMDAATMTYLQRGNTYPTVQCFNELLESFWKRGLKESDVWVSFDEPHLEGISIGFDGSDEQYTCEQGELRVWEMGRYDVLKRYE